MFKTWRNLMQSSQTTVLAAAGLQNSCCVIYLVLKFSSIKTTQVWFGILKSTTSMQILRRQMHKAEIQKKTSCIELNSDYFFRQLSIQTKNGTRNPQIRKFLICQLTNMKSVKLHKKAHLFFLHNPGEEMFPTTHGSCTCHARRHHDSYGPLYPVAKIHLPWASLERLKRTSWQHCPRGAFVFSGVVLMKKMDNSGMRQFLWSLAGPVLSKSSPTFPGPQFSPAGWAANQTQSKASSTQGWFHLHLQSSSLHPRA